MSLANGVEKLFRSDYSKLVRALSFTYGLDAAADAVQEAFIAADRNWWRVRHYGNPSAWVSRVAINSLKSGRRNELRRNEILRSLPDASQTPATEAAMDLRHAIDSLPERMRLAICLHYLADLPGRPTWLRQRHDQVEPARCALSASDRPDKGRQWITRSRRTSKPSLPMSTSKRP